MPGGQGLQRACLPRPGEKELAGQGAAVGWPEVLAM
jgi:hypothetical protein